MVSPLQKEREKEMLNHLVERFASKDLFVDNESQQYLFKMNSIDKRSAIGNLAWAYYYACSQNEQATIASFKNALHFGSSISLSVLTSMLSYLIQIGAIGEYVKALEEEYFFLKPHNKLSVQVHITNYYFVDGDIENIIRYIEDVKADKTAYSNIYQILDLKREVGMNNDQMKKLMSIMTSIANKGKLNDLNVSTIVDKAHNINALVFYTSCKSPEAIAQANLELAYEIADHDDLSEMNFSPMFDYCEDVPSLLEPM